MRRLSFRSLITASALLTGLVDAKATTVVISSTITTCPTPSTKLPCPEPTGTITDRNTDTATGTATSVTSSSSSSTTTTTTTTTSSVAAPACTDFWLEKISHQGVAPFGGEGYQVFRNVKDFGAKGDGVTDDTEAINRAISEGSRCGPGCTGSTKEPAIVYFPPGTYMVSSPIIDFYYTQLVGNPGCMPVLKATPDFDGPWLLDSNQYGENGLAWGATNVFWRQIHNFELDVSGVDPGTAIAALHWPSSQSTSLHNIVFRMSAAANTNHQGLFIEEGSGGYMGDLVFYGGAQAMSIGNQQFTMRNITVHHAKTAIQQIWSWGWTYQGVSINNCDIGFDFTSLGDEGNLNVGSITILDSEIKDTRVGIVFGSEGATSPPVANNFIFENVRIDNVETAIQGPSGTVLEGTTSSSVIDAWGRGHKYSPSSTGPTFFEGAIPPNPRPSALAPGGDAFYSRSRTYYEHLPATEFLSARDAGAAGDAETDDTDALNELFATAAASGKVAFLDAGIYRVTGTVRIPAGSRIFGEAFPIILSSGPFFADEADPKPVVQVGAPGETGRVEWTNTIVSSRGSQPGALLIQYNLASPQEPSALWDVHTRVGGYAGSELQLEQCAKTPDIEATPDNINRACIAAFMSMHITASAGGLYAENCWLWVADHDMEEGADNQQITVYAGRGLLIESADLPVWLVGTSVEHHQMYEYMLTGARGVYMGQIQTETAYYQPNPDASLPFARDARFRDPAFAAGESGWGLRVVDSRAVYVYGAGLYSFFDNNDVLCSQIGEGARCQSRIFSVEGDSEVRVFNLNTVGTNKMITVDGVDVANYEDNIDGFVHSVALFGTAEEL
ncbi:hypothetical protein VTK26DRAFT_8634 [Humicola hyalothermophila]